MLMIGAALAADNDDSKGDKDKKKEGPPPPDPIMTECIVPFRPAIYVGASPSPTHRVVYAGAPRKVTLDPTQITDAKILALEEKVKHYQAQLKKYRDCLQPKMTAAESSGDRSADADVVKKYNDSVEAETEVVEAYNKIVAAYKLNQQSASASSTHRN
jgi:hypothetical protein